jgi:hypothetical protein
MTGKRAEGMASGESKRAMAAGAGGILRTGVMIFVVLDSAKTILLTCFIFVYY